MMGKTEKQTWPKETVTAKSPWSQCCGKKTEDRVDGGGFVKNAAGNKKITDGDSRESTKVTGLRKK